jgi:Arc/MetJ family transcription regulator
VAYGEDFEGVEYRDYIMLGGRQITLSMVRDRVQQWREEIEEHSGTLKAFAVAEDVAARDYPLTNYLGKVAAQLARAYALSREAKAYRSALKRALDELVYTEYGQRTEDAEVMTGRNKEQREAFLFAKYRMLYQSLALLSDFTGGELADYINELATMKDALSRQVSSLDTEYRIMNGQ